MTNTGPLDNSLLRDAPPTNGHYANPAPKPERIRNPNRKFSTELQQATAIRDISHKLVMSMQDDLAALSAAPSPKNAAIVRAARRSVAVSLRMAVMAWETACDRVRIAKRIPLPGSLRPEAKAKKPTPKSGHSKWTESPEPTPHNDSQGTKPSLPTAS
jgi:hypothetical protein